MSLLVDRREVFVAQKVGAKLLSTADEPGAGAECCMSSVDCCAVRSDPWDVLIPAVSESEASRSSAFK